MLGTHQIAYQYAVRGDVEPQARHSWPRPLNMIVQNAFTVLGLLSLGRSHASSLIKDLAGLFTRSGPQIAETEDKQAEAEGVRRRNRYSATGAEMLPFEAALGLYSSRWFVRREECAGGEATSRPLRPLPR